MAVGETVVTMVGNVLSDLTKRTVSSGVPVVSFWMRSHERRRDKDSGEWVDGRQFTVRVSCWRKLAEGVHASLAKGDPVIVHGRLFESDFEPEGGGRATPELEAFAIGPNLNRCTTLVQRTRAQPGTTDTGGVPEPRRTGAGEQVVDDAAVYTTTGS